MNQRVLSDVPDPSQTYFLNCVNSVGIDLLLPLVYVEETGPQSS